MSSSLFAQTLLLLIEGKSVPSSTIDALRELCPDVVEAPAVEPAVVEPAPEPAVVEPAPEPAVVEPAAKPKAAAKPKVAKIKNVVPKAAAAPAAAAPAPAPAAAAPAAAPAATNADPWRNHPSRLRSIKPGYCVARGIAEKKHVAGTGTDDPDANGKFFFEKQCSTKLTEGASGSKLCEKCAGKEADSKLSVKERKSKGTGKWYGRLDEESLYPMSYVVGCAHFLSQYPNGIAGDSYRPGDAAPTATAEAVAPAKTARGKQAPAATPSAAAAAVETVAVDTVPKNIDWLSFMYEGRLHIRNVKTGKTYYADSQKHSREEMAVKEHYVGRWVDGALELDDDSDDE